MQQALRRIPIQHPQAVHDAVDDMMQNGITKESKRDSATLRHITPVLEEIWHVLGLGYLRAPKGTRHVQVILESVRGIPYRSI